jgi:hypothetical protein
MNPVLSSAEAVLSAIGEPGAYGGKPPFWMDAMAARGPGTPPFLDLSTLATRREAAGLPEDRDALLVDMATQVAGDPALSAFAWYLHWRVFLAPEKGVPWGIPMLMDRLGDRAGAFYLLLALEFPSRLAAWHRRLGYPSVIAATLQQISCFEANHVRGRGRPGLYGTQYAWLASYLVDPYVRLGRFEFQLHAYGGGVSAWRREADGQVLALAEQGVRLDDKGQLLNKTAPPEAGWTASLEETSEAVTGFHVDPEGHVIRKSVRLDRAAWKPSLHKGMDVLDLHIPPGGGMTWEAFTDSIGQALDFFARYHADRPFAALTCNTWFLDPQLADLLPCNANPLRLQRAVYLYPIGWDAGGLWFVFLCDTVNVDAATLPRDTALQRALAEFLSAGGKWNCGGMFVAKEDCRDSLKMSPCNSIEMSPLKVTCRKAGRPDGDDRDEHEGAAADDVDVTGGGGIAEVANGSGDVGGVVPAGEADLAAVSGRRRRRCDKARARAEFEPDATGGGTEACDGVVRQAVRGVRAVAGERTSGE